MSNFISHNFFRTEQTQENCTIKASFDDKSIHKIGCHARNLIISKKVNIANNPKKKKTKHNNFPIEINGTHKFASQKLCPESGLLIKCLQMPIMNVFLPIEMSAWKRCLRSTPSFCHSSWYYIPIFHSPGFSSGKNLEINAKHSIIKVSHSISQFHYSIADSRPKPVYRSPFNRNCVESFWWKVLKMFAILNENNEISEESYTK